MAKVKTMDDYPMRLMTSEEVELGRLVRQVWLDFCKQSRLPESHSHNAPWEELSLWEKNVDVSIGETLFAAGEKEQFQRDCAMLCDDCADGITIELDDGIWRHTGRRDPLGFSLSCKAHLLRVAWAERHEARV